jgi:hypothetical protein
MKTPPTDPTTTTIIPTLSALRIVKHSGCTLIMHGHHRH